MRLSEFDYNLPEELIAQYPLKKRDQARLMIIDRRKATIVHDRFCNLGKYLPPQCCFVLNDTKVVPARLLGHREKTGGRVEIFLLKKLSDGYTYETLIRPLRKLKVGEYVVFPKSTVKAEIIDKEKRLVRFNRKAMQRHLNAIGHIPLPPYIKREDQDLDKDYYQTIFAKKAGSVASPTAGLHFTDGLLKKIKAAGHKVQHVTLHINYATFKPVEEEDITKHKIHYEDYVVSPQSWKKINSLKDKGQKVVAVGTTSCRVLETVAQNKILEGSSNLFAYPGFKFKMTDILITNFHLPFSTLLMLVYAFGGKELMTKAYQEAVAQKYRFFSYGDAMMII